MLLGQIAVFVAMCAIVFLVVVGGMEFTQQTWVRDRTLLDIETKKPVRAANVENTKGLMYLATLPTEAFSHLKTTTIIFDMMGTSVHFCSESLSATHTLQPQSALSSKIQTSIPLLYRTR